MLAVSIVIVCTVTTSPVRVNDATIFFVPLYDAGLESTESQLSPENDAESAMLLR
jgi:hypothetical protein